MSNKFDLDNIKSFIDNSENSSKSSDFLLSDILKDFSSNKENKKETITTVEQDINDSKNVKIDFQKHSVIDEDVKKPEGYSLTGAFEAIKTEKNTPKYWAEVKTEKVRTINGLLIILWNTTCPLLICMIKFIKVLSLVETLLQRSKIKRKTRTAVRLFGAVFAIPSK